MAFTDMNDVEQELGEEKPPERNGNRTFLIIAGTLGGIMVLALLCIAGLALFRYLPNQRATQNAEATKAAQDTAIALSASQTASVPTATATRQPSYTPTNTRAPTNTPVIVIAPTKSPTVDIAIATRDALLTQIAVTAASSAQASATPPRPTTTALPPTGIGDELGTPGLLAAGFVLVVIIFLMRRLRTTA
jgi:cytoskeletal protein RodZ